MGSIATGAYYFVVTRFVWRLRVYVPDNFVPGLRLLYQMEQCTSVEEWCAKCPDSARYFKGRALVCICWLGFRERKPAQETIAPHHSKTFFTVTIEPPPLHVQSDLELMLWFQFDLSSHQLHDQIMGHFDQHQLSDVWINHINMNS